MISKYHNNDECTYIYIYVYITFYELYIFFLHMKFQGNDHTFHRQKEYHRRKRTSLEELSHLNAHN